MIYIYNLHKNISLSSDSGALTVRAGFVNEIAEVEQGGPGSQVLNKPLTREKSQKSVLQGMVERNLIKGEHYKINTSATKAGTCLAVLAEHFILLNSSSSRSDSVVDCAYTGPTRLISFI